MPGLNLADVRKVPIALAPLQEQDEIIRRVKALLVYADQVEARFKAARARIENLTPAILAKAFRGELVPQDPSDESASVLLERIRSDPAKSAGKDGKPVRNMAKKSHPLR